MTDSKLSGVLNALGWMPAEGVRASDASAGAAAPPSAEAEAAAPTSGSARRGRAGSQAGSKAVGAASAAVAAPSAATAESAASSPAVSANGTVTQSVPSGAIRMRTKCLNTFFREQTLAPGAWLCSVKPAATVATDLHAVPRLSSASPMSLAAAYAKYAPKFWAVTRFCCRTAAAPKANVPAYVCSCPNPFACLQALWTSWWLMWRALSGQSSRALTWRATGPRLSLLRSRRSRHGTQRMLACRLTREPLRAISGELITVSFTRTPSTPSSSTTEFDAAAETDHLKCKCARAPEPMYGCEPSAQSAT